MRAYEAILKRAKAVWEHSDYDKVTISSSGAEITLRNDGPGFGVVPKSPGDAGLYLWPDTVDLIVEASEIARETRGEKRRWLDLDDKEAVKEFLLREFPHPFAPPAASSWLPVPEGTLSKVVGGRIPGGAELTAEQVVAILRASGVMK